MQWVDFVDQIYLVNLPQRTDRLVASAEELERFGIPYKRWAAKYNEHHGAIGLRDSMIDLFRSALDLGYKNVLVFEDDVMFVRSDVNEVMNKAIDQLPPDYRILFLGCQPTAGFTRFQSENLLPVTKAYATHAVMYSELAMRECVNLGLGYPIDNWIVDNIQPKGGCFVTYPLLATQRPDYSDIGRTHIDWSPFIVQRYNQKIQELKSRT